jgi:hypothetical protein
MRGERQMDTEESAAQAPVMAQAMDTKAPPPPDPMRQVAEIRSAVLEAITPADSNLVRHAIFELERIGELSDGGAYGGMIARSALDLIRVLAIAGHSGGSIQGTLSLFERLARFDVLSPITAHPSEWSLIPPVVSPGTDRMWQSKRKPSVFWREGEPTWYDLDDPARAS